MHDLTRVGLAVSLRRAGGDWFGRCALGFAGLVAGAAAGYWFGVHGVYAGQQAGQMQQQAAAHDRQQLAQRLEQAQLTLSVSEARSHELERQIESFIQRVRECQEELTFFRKGTARTADH
jgi:hypothetical protein